MEIIGVGVLGGLLALDGTSVGQFMVSRPLVAGTLTGWALGDVTLGLAIGSILELYLIVSFPTGGTAAPEGATATVVSVASVAGLSGAGVVPVAVAIGLLWGQVGGYAVTTLRKANARRVPEPSDVVTTSVGLTRAHVGGIGLDLLRGCVVTLVGAGLGRLLAPAVVSAWALSAPSGRALLFLGVAVSGGILLRDLGGVRRYGIAVAAGAALAAVGIGVR